MVEKRSENQMISEQQNPTRCEPLIDAERAAELLMLHPKTVKRLAQAVASWDEDRSGLAVSGILAGRLDVCAVRVFRPPESKRRNASK